MVGRSARRSPSRSATGLRGAPGRGVLGRGHQRLRPRPGPLARQPGLRVGGPRGPGDAGDRRPATTPARSWTSRCRATAGRPARTTGASTRAPRGPRSAERLRLRPGLSQINVADLGQAPQDGFSEYDGYTPGIGRTGPRWGDYSAAVYDRNGQFYFATELHPVAELHRRDLHCRQSARAAEPATPSPTGGPRSTRSRCTTSSSPIPRFPRERGPGDRAWRAGPVSRGARGRDLGPRRSRGGHPRAVGPSRANPPASTRSVV